jgi:hypothetical protein
MDRQVRQLSRGLERPAGRVVEIERLGEPIDLLSRRGAGKVDPEQLSIGRHSGQGVREREDLVLPIGVETPDVHPVGVGHVRSRHRDLLDPLARSGPEQLHQAVRHGRERYNGRIARGAWGP